MFLYKNMKKKNSDKYILNNVVGIFYSNPKLVSSLRWAADNAGVLAVC